MDRGNETQTLLDPRHLGGRIRPIPRFPRPAEIRQRFHLLILQRPRNAPQEIRAARERQAGEPQAACFVIPENEDVVPDPTTGGEGQRLSVQYAAVNYNRIAERSVGCRHRHSVHHVVGNFASREVADLVGADVAVEVDRHDISQVVGIRVTRLARTDHRRLDSRPDGEAAQAKLPEVQGDAVLEDRVEDYSAELGKISRLASEG